MRKFIVILGGLLVSACQSTLVGTVPAPIYLSKEIPYWFLSVKSSAIEQSFTQKVTYYDATGRDFDYLVQTEINADSDTMAFVATSLLGIPLFSFEVNHDQVDSVQRLNERLPDASRVLIDMQLVFWPLRAFTESDNLIRVNSLCNKQNKQCHRQIYSNDQLIYLISYPDVASEPIVVLNKLHNYRMTIRNL